MMFHVVCTYDTSFTQHVACDSAVVCLRRSWCLRCLVCLWCWSMVAGVVVAPHGASLMNTLFLTPMSSVIEVRVKLPSTCRLR